MYSPAGMMQMCTRALREWRKRLSRCGGLSLLCEGGGSSRARGALFGSFAHGKGGKWLPTSLIRPILLIRIIL